MADNLVPELSETQQQQALLVQQDLLEVMNGHIAEGIDPRIIMAGSGAAVATLVAAAFGMDKVSTWYAQQAAIAYRMVG